MENFEAKSNDTKENTLMMAKEYIFISLEGKTLIKEIYVPEKLINFVVKENNYVKD